MRDMKMKFLELKIAEKKDEISSELKLEKKI